MKKLMFGIAAISAGICFADISSANVVGYNNYPLVQGYSFFSPVFEKIGGDLNIQDLKLVSTTGADLSSGLNMICVIDDKGMSGDTYKWVTAAVEGIDHDGWFDVDNLYDYWDIDVTEGEGFYIYCFDSDLALQTSGQVKLTSYSRDLVTGFNIVGNCSPVDVNIQDFKLVSKTGADLSSGLNMICVIDDNGMSGDTYKWVTAAVEGIDHDGWFDVDNLYDYWDVDFKAGEGAYIFAFDADIQFVLKSAFEKSVADVE